MKQALIQAELAYNQKEVPVGAVIVESSTNQIIAKAYNQVEVSQDPTAHAEILAIREACYLTANFRLTNCDLYVTLEPCAMCAQAISLARIRRLYYGAYDQKSGAVEHGARIYSHSTCHHIPKVYDNILANQASNLLSNFFNMIR